MLQYLWVLLVVAVLVLGIDLNKLCNDKSNPNEDSIGYFEITVDGKKIDCINMNYEFHLAENLNQACSTFCMVMDPKFIGGTCFDGICNCKYREETINPIKQIVCDLHQS